MPPRVLPGLARHPQLKVRKMVPGQNVLARREVVPLGMLAYSDALAHPDGAGTENAPQLAGTWQVSSVA